MCCDEMANALAGRSSGTSFIQDGMILRRSKEKKMKKPSKFNLFPFPSPTIQPSSFRSYFSLLLLSCSMSDYALYMPSSNSFSSLALHFTPRSISAPSRTPACHRSASPCSPSMSILFYTHTHHPPSLPSPSLSFLCLSCP